MSGFGVGAVLRRVSGWLLGPWDWRQVILLPILVVLAAVTFCHFAFSQEMCGPYKDARETLAKKYHEERIGQGIVQGALVLELYVSAQGTWTLIAIDGARACLVASGVNWRTERGPSY